MDAHIYLGNAGLNKARQVPWLQEISVPLIH